MTTVTLCCGAEILDVTSDWVYAEFGDRVRVIGVRESAAVTQADYIVVLNAGFPRHFIGVVERAARSAARLVAYSCASSFEAVAQLRRLVPVIDRKKCGECNGRGHFLFIRSTPQCTVCCGTGKVI